MGLRALEDTVTWARMEFKPKKSHCMIIKKGALQTDLRWQCKAKRYHYIVIVANPVKGLGKWFDYSFEDTRNKKNVEDQLRQWLRLIERRGFPGKYQTRIYQHGGLSRLLWMMMLYEIPISTAEEVERCVNSFLRRWLGVPLSFTFIGLYSRTAKLQLPLSSLVHEFKVSKCRLVMTLRDSKDEIIRKAGVQTRTGRKWSASQAVKQAEDMLTIRDIVGNTCVGSSKFKPWKAANGKDRRDMVQEEIRREEEEVRKARAVEMGQKGAWTRWNVPERKITWADLWRMEPLQISFLLRSVYDVLPSPSNLLKWGLLEMPDCQVCGARGTMADILSGCKLALQQGRYRWRHDQVLRSIAEILEGERKKSKPTTRDRPRGIRFVRAGETARTSSERSSILDGSVWQMKVDLMRKLVFPDVIQTSLRPDCGLQKAKDNHHRANSAMGGRLRRDPRTKELKVLGNEGGMPGSWVENLVISSWSGMPRISCPFHLDNAKSYRDLWCTRKRAVRTLGETAEKASCWIWQLGDIKEWKPHNTQWEKHHLHCGPTNSRVSWF